LKCPFICPHPAVCGVIICAALVNVFITILEVSGIQTYHQPVCMLIDDD